jgi:hypothetical protein
MTRALFAITSIVLGVTVAVFMQDTRCATAQAQTQAESPERTAERTAWDHNGSAMYLIANGALREFYYEKPRPGMLEAGARPGSLLFRGEFNNGQYLGTAYIFNSHCGPIPFEVRGAAGGDDDRIVLSGEAPRVGRNCQTNGLYPTNLEFRRSIQSEAAQSQESSGPAQSAPAAQKGADLSGAPLAQPPAPKESPTAAKAASSAVTDRKLLSAARAEAPTAKQAPEAQDLNKYKWAAAFILISIWLLIVWFGRMFITKRG